MHGLFHNGRLYNIVLISMALLSWVPFPIDPINPILRHSAEEQRLTESRKSGVVTQDQRSLG